MRKIFVNIRIIFILIIFVIDVKSKYYINLELMHNACSNHIGIICNRCVK